MVANIADPTLEMGEWVRQIDSISEEAKGYLNNFYTAEERLSALPKWLFDPKMGGPGFSGNRKQYGDPRNSYINEVLTRRLGIPITLSIICIEVAKRLSMHFEGIGLPGHFVVGGFLGGEKLPILFDPFNQGQIISQDECAKLVSHTTGYIGKFEESWLEPTSHKLILIRMLNNLRVGFMRLEQWSQAIDVIRHLRILQPDLPAHLRDEGLIQFHIQNYWESSLLLEEYLSAKPDADDVGLIKSTVSQLFEQHAKLN